MSPSGPQTYACLRDLSGVSPGPGAGHDGGRIVFEGTPADPVRKKGTTLTGQHLGAFVNG